MMIGFDKTITIYNKKYDIESKKTMWYKTVISGASWAGCQRVTTGNGLTSNDGYNIRIPKECMPKNYIHCDEYAKIKDVTGYCTAQVGDVVVLGEGADVTTGITDITKKYTDSFTIIAVHSDNLSRFLPHLRLEGK